MTQKKYLGGFLGGAVLKNPPANAGGAGSSPDRGTKIPHATEELSPPAATTEPTYSGAHVPQPERSLRAATKDPACHN